MCIGILKCDVPGTFWLITGDYHMFRAFQALTMPLGCRAIAGRIEAFFAP
jgi:hypothetical protein